MCECLREDLATQQHSPYSHHNHQNNNNNNNNINHSNNHMESLVCVDNNYFENKDESKDESKDEGGGGYGGDEQLFLFRSKLVVRPLNQNPTPSLSPNPNPSSSPGPDMGGYAAEAPTTSPSLPTFATVAAAGPNNSSLSEPLSLSLPAPESEPLDAPPSTTSPPRTGVSLLASPPLSPPVSPTHLSPSKRKASLTLTLTPSHSQQDVELAANAIRTQVRRGQHTL